MASELEKKIRNIIEGNPKRDRTYCPPEFWEKVAIAQKCPVSPSKKTRLLRATLVSPDEDGTYGHQELELVRLAAKWVNRWCTYNQIEATVLAVLNGTQAPNQSMQITIDVETN